MKRTLEWSKILFRERKGIWAKGHKLRVATDGMAEAAMTVTRLLNNNLPEVILGDAKKIYEEAY